MGLKIGLMVNNPRISTIKIAPYSLKKRLMIKLWLALCLVVELLRRLTIQADSHISATRKG
jgi:hypothetical protein